MPPPPIKQESFNTEQHKALFREMSLGIQVGILETGAFKADQSLVILTSYTDYHRYIQWSPGMIAGLAPSTGATCTVAASLVSFSSLRRLAWRQRGSLVPAALSCCACCAARARG